MGRETVPFLIRKLDDAPSEKVRRLLLILAPKRGERYRQHKLMWQTQAAYLLGELGPVAKSAESNLTVAAASSNRGLQEAATAALIKIRQDSLQPLVERLNDMSDWRVWGENVRMVRQFGASAEPAVPRLLEALQHTNAYFQNTALVALAMIGQRPEKCIPVIVPFLNSPRGHLRGSAMVALLAFGTNAVSAKTAIEATLTDPDPWVRSLAETALKKLQAIEIGAPNGRARSAEPDA